MPRSFTYQSGGLHNTPDWLDAAFLAEWKILEDFRIECCKDILDICRSINKLRGKLTDDMIEVLVEEKWKEAEVTRSLAAVTVNLLKALKGLENPRRIEEIVESDGGWGDGV